MFICSNPRKNSNLRHTKDLKKDWPYNKGKGANLQEEENGS